MAQASLKLIENLPSSLLDTNWSKDWAVGGPRGRAGTSSFPTLHWKVDGAGVEGGYHDGGSGVHPVAKRMVAKKLPKASEIDHTDCQR